MEMNMKNVFQKEITMDIKKHVAGPAEGPPSTNPPLNVSRPVNQAQMSKLENALSDMQQGLQNDNVIWNVANLELP